jgi:hypothetical protein
MTEAELVEAITSVNATPKARLFAADPVDHISHQIA